MASATLTKPAMLAPACSALHATHRRTPLVRAQPTWIRHAAPDSPGAGRPGPAAMVCGQRGASPGVGVGHAILLRGRHGLGVDAPHDALHRTHTATSAAGPHTNISLASPAARSAPGKGRASNWETEQARAGGSAPAACRRPPPWTCARGGTRVSGRGQEGARAAAARKGGRQAGPRAGSGSGGTGTRGHAERQQRAGGGSPGEALAVLRHLEARHRHPACTYDRRGTGMTKRDRSMEMSHAGGQQIEEL